MEKNGSGNDALWLHGSVRTPRVANSSAMPMWTIPRLTDPGSGLDDRAVIHVEGSPDPPLPFGGGSRPPPPLAGGQYEIFFQAIKKVKKIFFGRFDLC